jgi:hypothetical protein
MNSGERSQHIGALLAHMSGKMQEVGLKHDASRAIQLAVKYATEVQKHTIIKELTGHFKQLSEEHYGHYIIIKLLSNDTKKNDAKKQCLKEFKGHINKVRRNHGAEASLPHTLSSRRTDIRPFRTLGFCKGAIFSQGMHVDIHNAERLTTDRPYSVLLVHVRCTYSSISCSLLVHLSFLQLSMQPDSAKVLDYLYASSPKKGQNSILLEFYSPEFIVFADDEATKEKTLAEIIQNKPEKKNQILDNIRKVSAYRHLDTSSHPSTSPLSSH